MKLYVVTQMWTDEPCERDILLITKSEDKAHAFTKEHAEKELKRYEALGFACEIDELGNECGYYIRGDGWSSEIYYSKYDYVDEED